MCFQVKGLKRKQHLEQNGPADMKKAKSVSYATEVMQAAESSSSTGPSSVHARAGKANGFFVDENGKPMFREYDLSELPAEARPHPNKVHSGQHGFTAVSSNYAAARITVSIHFTSI